MHFFISFQNSKIPIQCMRTIKMLHEYKILFYKKLFNFFINHVLSFPGLISGEVLASTKEMKAILKRSTTKWIRYKLLITLMMSAGLRMAIMNVAVQMTLVCVLQNLQGVKVKCFFKKNWRSDASVQQILKLSSSANQNFVDCQSLLVQNSCMRKTYGAVERRTSIV